MWAWLNLFIKHILCYQIAYRQQTHCTSHLCVIMHLYEKPAGHLCSDLITTSLNSIRKTCVRQRASHIVGIIIGNTIRLIVLLALASITHFNFEAVVLLVLQPHTIFFSTFSFFKLLENPQPPGLMTHFLLCLGYTRTDNSKHILNQIESGPMSNVQCFKM